MATVEDHHRDRFAGDDGEDVEQTKPPENEFEDPNQTQPGIVFPTVEEIANSPSAPTQTCWRETIDDRPDTRAGGWTDWKFGSSDNQPDLQNRANIILVLMRFSPRRQNGEHALCRAGSAVVGARLHQLLQPLYSHMPGRTLIILMDTTTRCLRGDNWFTEILTLVYGMLRPLYPTAQPKPHLWLVSRSLSSLYIYPTDVWSGLCDPADGMLEASWWPYLHLIYQVAGRFPLPHRATIGPPPAPGTLRWVPWNPDPVYAMKWMCLPLRSFVSGSSNYEPPDWEVLRSYLRDEWARYEGGPHDPLPAVPVELKRKMFNRNLGRLGFFF